MILSVTLNPSVDHTLLTNGLHLHDTNRVQRTETDAGGKGLNLSRIVTELGGETVATGFLGGGSGAYIQHRLDEEGVPHRFVAIRGVTRTNINIEAGDGPPTTLNERGPEISPEEWAGMKALVTELAPRAGWVTFGGSLPPGIGTDAWVELVRLVRSVSGARVLVDADGESMQLALAEKPDLMKPNAAEAGRLVGFAVEGDASAIEAARQLQGRTGGDVIVSRGAAGAVLATAEGCWIAPGIPVEVRSTIGSGDSMLGGYLSVLDRSGGPAEALAMGLAAGAATAMSDGTAIGLRADMDRLQGLATVRAV